MFDVTTIPPITVKVIVMGGFHNGLRPIGYIGFWF